MIKRFASLFMIFGLLAIGGCSFLGDQADIRLGEACTPEVRVERAQLLYDLLSDRYGQEVTADLAEPLAVMYASLESGASLDPAGDAYKLQFVGVAVDVLERQGIKTALKGYSEAVEVLRGLPELAAGINLIEARVGIACARALNSDPPDKADLSLVPKAKGFA